MWRGGRSRGRGRREGRMGEGGCSGWCLLKKPFWVPSVLNGVDEAGSLREKKYLVSKRVLIS